LPTDPTFGTGANHPQRMAPIRAAGRTIHAPGRRSVMDPEAQQTGTFTRQLLQRKAARWWWVPLVGALLWFLIGWMVLRADYSSLVAVGVLVGAVLLMAAINEGALAAVMRNGWGVLHIVLAIIFVLGAFWAFVRPVNTFFALASVLGLIVLLQGITALTRGFALREEASYWWLDVVSGGLLILLGIWVSTSDRIWDLRERAVFILLWVGFLAIFRGISNIALAFTLRSFARDAGRQLAAAAPTDAAAPIPTQQARASVPDQVPTS
jgi:uncharacterized membrane protein HdeD (DUF308 family)